jgi:glycosyltransferase involved in cell wall biosynthesis
MRSVLDQTYDRIEYVVVDGLSADQTVAIAHRVAAEYPQRDVRIVSEADRGIADAMNKGIRLTTGALVAHMHSGDRYVDSQVISRVVESHQRLGWRWGVGSSNVVDKRGRVSHVYQPSGAPRSLLAKNTIPHQSTFLVRDVFERHGLFRTDLKQASDYDYWVRIGLQGDETVAVLPFVVSCYLEGGGSDRIRELLGVLWQIRSEMRRWKAGNSYVSDLLFVSRVAAFWAYSHLRPVTG